MQYEANGFGGLFTMQFGRFSLPARQLHQSLAGEPGLEPVGQLGGRMPCSA